ncbi:hypothetical protein [Paratractidigestivibacter faecalis]|uniref:Uncharacterized protein n=1 Tax=Paratractidigestivibacter faecalis TaxID=2292441 RepID=A0ABV1IDQ9_9ACTN
MKTSDERKDKPEALSWHGSIPAPRDAEGREIPLDTKVMYDSLGNEYEVLAWSYLPNSGGWSMSIPHSKTKYVPESLRLAKPDSWESLEEDVMKNPCEYFGLPDEGCDVCPGKDSGCLNAYASDVVRRAKALAGVSDRD